MTLQNNKRGTIMAITIKDLIYQLEELGGELGFDSEVWIAANRHTEPLVDVSKCLDMDTNIYHAQLSGEWKTLRELGI